MTGLDVANASLLDEGTAAAEAMSLCFRHNKRRKIYLSQNLHPQTLSVVETRLKAFDIEVVIGPISDVDLSNHEYSGILLQYPDTYGNVTCFESIATEARKNGVSLKLLLMLYIKKFFSFFRHWFVLLPTCWLSLFLGHLRSLELTLQLEHHKDLGCH